MTAGGTDVQLRCSTPSGRVPRRDHEPVSFGLPFPKGRLRDTSFLCLRADDDTAVPLQTRVLDRWSDGSIRWALIDFQASSAEGDATHYRLSDDVAERPACPTLSIVVGEGDASIDAGLARFCLFSDGRLTWSDRAGMEGGADCRLRLVDPTGRPHTIDASKISCEVEGPLRSVLLVTGRIDIGGRRPLEVTTRYHFHAGSPVVRIAVTLRNPARAVHAGGYWDLGDPSSQLIRDFSFLITPRRGESAEVFCSPEAGSPVRSCDGTVVLYQDSSGGEHWNSPNHRNRTGIVPLRFRGYRLRTGTEDVTALRATPVVRMQTPTGDIAIAHRRFWQRFPKAMSVADGTLRLGLLPEEFGDVHELQGGEQITEEFVMSVADDGIGDSSLDWVRDPLCVSADPAWYCMASAMPHLTPVDEDPNRGHRVLVNAAIEGDDTFARKRERVDEYGWRNFGDLYADHEAVRHQGAGIFVSHYNNQYDAIAGMAVQYFRSGDLRWLELLDDLARHVIDIDVYHTTEDKSAYNGGLFWHTAHHIDADLATHRTYPRSGGASGGPAPEHNYNTGLMLYFFLTGDPRAREAVLSLARWVIDMDDGEKNPLKWISRGRTGVASATGSFSYHGPGRAPGNSIVALVNAFRITGEHTYLAKADELIRRCSHPADDIESRNLLDAERRWFYTVFLQALGRYLELKEELQADDDGYAYARAVLLHYAAWMAEHEYPYLEKPEILEFPNETWAAQDMRKSEVFNYASRYAAPVLRTRLLERSRYFFDYSVSTLLSMPTRTFTRPLVLMLTNGYAQCEFQRSQHAEPPEPATSAEFGVPARFVPQRTIALRRLRLAAAILAAGAIAAIAAIAR